MANHAGKDIDVTVFGATGFTGRLVAEYLAQTYPAGSGVTWAMAGRNRDKLEAVREEIGAPVDTTMLVADSADQASLEALAARSKVILSTVGPYQIYGNELVEVCAATGTDYVDLCGEPAWMWKIIDRHASQAAESGARIVLSCGFDSIPFDLGVLFLQDAAKARFGRVCNRVDSRVVKMVGTFSGGTVESFKASMKAAKEDPSLLAVMKSSFALTPGFEGPRQPSMSKPREDDVLEGMWVAPFVMAPINTKNIHRSNMLMGHAYGEDFSYSEMSVTGRGEKGKALAERLTASGGGLVSDKQPKPGEGPSKEERENGSYEVLIIGQTAAGETLSATVKGDRDPGYGSTSKMIAEAALCLAKDRTDTPGGIWTSAPALGTPLIERLTAKAGLSFDLA